MKTCSVLVDQHFTTDPACRECVALSYLSLAHLALHVQSLPSVCTRSADLDVECFYLLLITYDINYM